MASETVQKVLSAESMSDKEISDAKIRRDEIIAAAKTNADALLQEKVRDANNKCCVIQDENNAEIEKLRAEISEECSRQKALLKQTAEKNLDAASDFVFRYLLGS